MILRNSFSFFCYFQKMKDPTSRTCKHPNILTLFILGSVFDMTPCSREHPKHRCVVQGPHDEQRWAGAHPGSWEQPGGCFCLGVHRPRVAMALCQGPIAELSCLLCSAVPLLLTTATRSPPSPLVLPWGCF